MALTIKLGDKYIPIIKDVQITTGQLPLVYIGQGILNPQNPAEFYNGGIDLGSVYAPSEIIGGGVVSSCLLHSGETDIHNGARVIVDSPIEYQETGSLGSSFKGNFDGYLAQTLKSTWTQKLVINTTAQISPTLTTEDFYRISCCRLIHPSYDHPSYGIVITYMRTITDDQTHVQTEYGPYNVGNFTINPYEWKRRDNIEAYFEETEPVPPEPPEPTPPFDPSEPEDYNPYIDDTSDLISIPGNPTIGVTTAGWVHVYKPAQSALVNFGAWLFPNPELPSSADPTEIVNYLLLLCQTLANSRLIDYILDCHIIPVSPQVGSSQDIKVGGRTATGISAPVVTNDYIDATCGSLNIREYFGGYQDYLYTKSKLYLPFVGFVDTLPEYWQSGTISVDYKFNIIDGSFMAYVRSASSKSQLAGSVIAQYGGNACIHVPITGINYANMVSGLVGAAAAASGGKTAASVLGSAYSAANTILQGGDIIQSNAYNATAAMMGVRYPYLLIERPTPFIPSTYMHSKGYPSNIAALLSNVTGFTVIDDIDLSGIPLTQTELEELRGLLKEGVYF